MTKRVLMLCVVIPVIGNAGTNGILEGTVREKATGAPLPGTNIRIVGSQQGTTSIAEGDFRIHNVRAGIYEIRFSLLGYATHVIKNVIINSDLRTRLTIELESSDISLNEIVVVREKPLIQQDVTGITFIVSGSEMTALPVDQVTDIIALKAGVTGEGNVRGGKTTEVVYLVDGLPVQDVLSGGIGTNLPASSIVSLSLYTGGFEAEYGNALSGVVNIITKTGGNDHRFLVRADKDNLFGGTQVSKSTKAEVSASGPILDGRLYYVASATGLASRGS